MCPLNLLFLFFLTMDCRALPGDASSGVKWVNSGGRVTIQCSTDISSPDGFCLKRGLQEEKDDVAFLAPRAELIIHPTFLNRLQKDGELTKLSITITNLTVEDTGAFWCVYSKFDGEKNNLQTTDGGSLMLVVNGKQCKGEDHGIHRNLVLVIVFAAVSMLLLTVILVFLLIIPKMKAWRATNAPNPPKTSEVYEEMRATLRR